MNRTISHYNVIYTLHSYAGYDGNTQQIEHAYLREAIAHIDALRHSFGAYVTTTLHGITIDGLCVTIPV